MFIIGLIFNYAMQLAFFIIDLAIQFITGFLKGIYFLIAEGHNPFKDYWKPFVGFMKFAIVVSSAFIIWAVSYDVKNNRELYEEARKEKIETIKTKLHIKTKDLHPLTYTLAETERK